VKKLRKEGRSFGLRPRRLRIALYQLGVEQNFSVVGEQLGDRAAGLCIGRGLVKDFL